MISARFRIRLPEQVWVAQVSEQYPDATFRLLSGYRMDDRAVELGEVTARTPDAVAEAIRERPSILSFELLKSDERRVLGKYETTDLKLYEFVERSSLPIEFPVDVERGWFEFDLTGTREEFDRLRDRLDASPLPYELESLVSSATETDALLTDRQREVLDTAVRAGYFEVPRECTLEELAEEVGVDKSTASTVLRRGEARLIKWFRSGPEERR